MLRLLPLLSIAMILNIGCGNTTAIRVTEVESNIYGLDRNDPETKADFQVGVKAKIINAGDTQNVKWVGEMDNGGLQEVLLRCETPNLPYRAYSRFIFGRNDGNADVLEVTLMQQDQIITKFRTILEFK